MSERFNDAETWVGRDPDDARDRTFPPADLSDDTTLETAENALRKKLRKKLRKDELDVDAHWVENYRELADPTWYQRGQECTGFALAAIADYHLRKVVADDWDQLPPPRREDRTVSRRMLYEMAQEYDRQAYDEGSTLRGALRGWRKTGVACNAEWPYEAGDEHGEKHGRLSLRRVINAVQRPGGPYLRIDTTDTADMAANIKKSLLIDHPVYVSANHHVGWINLYLPDNTVINQPANGKMLGGHAFVIVGFDQRGWWIHNSWGREWGDDGYALLPYDDFAANRQDVWFVYGPPFARETFVPEDDLVRAAQPPTPTDRSLAAPRATSATADELPPAPDALADRSATQLADAGLPQTHSRMWRHIITIGDDGEFVPVGKTFGMNYDSLKTMLFLFRQQTAGWATRRLAIFADGGYWSTPTAVDQLAPLRAELMKNEIYPLFLVWDTPWFAAMQGRLYADVGLDEKHVGTDLAAFWNDVGGPPVAKFRAAAHSVPTMWTEMQRRAHRAAEGVGRQLTKSIEYNLTKANFELHLIGHGTGDLLLSRLAPLLPAPIRTCNLWAPATTVGEFDTRYRPLVDAGRLEQLTITVLDDAAESNDRMGPLPGSPLHLVSDVLAVERIEIDKALELYDGKLVWQYAPEPVVGLERFLPADVARRGNTNRLRANIVPDTTHTGLMYRESVWRDTVNAIRSTAFGSSPASTGAPFAPPSRHDTVESWTAAAVDPLEIIGGSDPLTANMHPL